MVVFVVWLITASYAVPLMTTPSLEICAAAASQEKKKLESHKPAVVKSFEMACIETMVMPSIALPGADKPGLSSYHPNREAAAE